MYLLRNKYKCGVKVVIFDIFELFDIEKCMECFSIFRYVRKSDFCYVCKVLERFIGYLKRIK